MGLQLRSESWRHAS